MRLNRFIASTLLTGLFVTTAMLPAHGQDKTLQPSGKWSISKIDRTAQGGNSYCTLSRKYEDGVVVSLGRSQTEEYSIAIDFQKPEFTKDKSVKINLQPGPGQIRAYDMMPASDKAVVIRLGWDTGFFDTLNKSQQMKVKIADHSYAFAMPEIAKGQDDLTNCMQELKTAAKASNPSADAAQTKDVLAAQAGSGSKAFDATKVEEGMKSAGAINAQKQIASGEKSVLKNFADKVQAQEPDTNDDSKAGRKNFAKTVKPGSDEDEALSTKSKAPMPPTSDDFDHKLSAADDPNPPQKTPDAKVANAEIVTRPEPVFVPEPVSSKSEKSDTKADKKDAAKPAKTASKSSDADDAKVMAATAPAAAPDAKQASIEIKSMEDRIAQLASENATLKQKLAVPQADPNQQKMVDGLQQENKALEDQIKALRDESAKKPGADDLAKIQQKANELDIRNKQLEEALKSAQTRIAETAVNTEGKALRQIADLQAKLDAAQKDNNDLAKQLDSLKLRSEDKGIAAVAGDWNLEQATKRYNEAEREIRRLGQQLEQERMSCNREKAEIEQMLFDPAVADQKQIQKLSQLQKDLDDAQAKIKDNTKLVQDEVNRQLATQVAAKTQSIEEQKDALQLQVVQLQKSSADSQATAAQKSALEAQVAQLQKSVADAQAAAAKKADLEAQVAQLQKSAADAQDIAAKKSELEAQIAQLQKTVAANQAVVAEKTALEAQVAQLQKQAADNQAIAAQKTALEAQVAQLQKTATAAQASAAEKTALQAQVTQLQKQAADNQAIVAQKTALEAQVAQLQKSASDAQSLVSEKTAMQAQITQLQKQVADNQAVLAQKTALEAQVAQLQKTATEAQASAAEKIAMQAQITQLQKQASDSKIAATEKAALAQQVATLQKTMADKDASLGNEKTALQTQVDSLKSALTQKEQQLATLNAVPKADPAADAKKIAEEVGKAKAASDQQIIALQTQLQTLQQQMGDKDKQLAAAQQAAQAGSVNAKQLSDLMANVESIKKDNAALHDQLIVARQEADRYRLQLVDVQSNGATRADQVASMQLQINDMKSQMEMKDRATATYQNQIASMQQDNAQLKARLSVADTNQGNSTNENSELVRQVQSLQNQVRDLQRQNAAKSERSASAAVMNAVTPAAGYVSAVAATPVAAVARTPIQPVSIPTASVSGGFDKGSIQSLLEKSGLNVNGVQKASSGFSGADNFSWKDSNNVSGLASVKTLKGGNFDKAVSDYIAYQKGQCSGDFASMPSPSNGSAAKQMALYEVACVGSGGQSQSASLVFFEDQGRFIAVSNQIDAANMDIAMDSRDKIAGFVRGL